MKNRLRDYLMAFFVVFTFSMFIVYDFIQWSWEGTLLVATVATLVAIILVRKAK